MNLFKEYEYFFNQDLFLFSDPNAFSAFIEELNLLIEQRPECRKSIKAQVLIFLAQIDEPPFIHRLQNLIREWLKKDRIEVLKFLIEDPSLEPYLDGDRIQQIENLYKNQVLRLDFLFSRPKVFLDLRKIQKKSFNFLEWHEIFNFIFQQIARGASDSIQKLWLEELEQEFNRDYSSIEKENMQRLLNPLIYSVPQRAEWNSFFELLRYASGVASEFQSIRINGEIASQKKTA